jgi:hypothetical protein
MRARKWPLVLFLTLVLVWISTFWPGPAHVVPTYTGKPFDPPTQTELKGR